MRIRRISEPRLQFGVGASVDVRNGLTNYCVADFEREDAIGQIRIGLIGSEKSIEKFCTWLDRCRNPIEAKASRQPNLFMPFPGFNVETGFKCELKTDSKLQRVIRQADIEALHQYSIDQEKIIRAVDLFVEQARDLLEQRKPDVLVCAIPAELLSAMDPEFTEPDDSVEDDQDGNTSDESSDDYIAKIDFHDLLKARCLVLPSACPLQLILPATYDPTSVHGKKTRRSNRAKPLQDEATRAWNFWTAIYYKAGGTPWRILKDPAALQTCHIGIGFFRTLDRQRINASVAQVFNERGEGVIVRGGEATYEKSDRQIHLDRDSSLSIVREAIEKYRFEHKTVPARVVIHKTSSFSPAELEGCAAAINSWNIEYCEMLSMTKSFVRLFRKEEYPPLRGTLLLLNESVAHLYTRGSVEFYETYPGMYMPRTLRIEAARTERTLEAHAEEILALTKMNWNDTQLDGAVPITIRAARQVGKILKYLSPSENLPHKYSYYI